MDKTGAKRSRSISELGALVHSGELERRITVYDASVNQLKHLVLVYRTRFPSAAYTILWQYCLLYVANATLQDKRDEDEEDEEEEREAAAEDDVDVDADAEDDEHPHHHLRHHLHDDSSEWWFWFYICITGYQKMFPSFRVVESIVQGLLTMAMNKGLLSAAEGRIMMERLRAGGQHSYFEHAVRGRFMVDLGMAATDPLGACVDALSERFDEMMLYDEFMANDAMATELDAD